MKKRTAPLYYKLISHNSNSPVSFHVPGHKMGRGINPIGKKYYNKISKLDLTEITGLDDLHNSNGVILEAEKRAANIFQASKTFFLVNGSTTGNIAMILATCQPGDKVIVQRNVHKSVINGLILAKANPIYINTEYISELGVAGSINKENLEELLKEHSNAKAVFIMNPNYYGIGCDITDIINISHEYNIPVLVDEAHGAHFGLHSYFPSSAIQLGADIVVNSTHKTLSAMTMGAMLHVNSKLIDIDRLKLFLAMIQSSSPSYPILASLDLTCEWIETKKEGLWDDTIQLINNFNRQAIILKNIKIDHKISEGYYIDPLKIIMHVVDKEYTGVKLQKNLESKNIYTELSDVYNTLAIITLGTRKRDIKYLLKNLKRIDDDLDDCKLREENEVTEFKNFLYPKIDTYSAFSIDKIIYGENMLVSLDDAVGKIAAEMVIPYPPGIPVIQLGEIITEEVINYIVYLEEIGIYIQGFRGDKLNKLKVVKI